MATMRAAVMHEAGKPSVLKVVSDWPKPTAKPGWVLIQVKAFGINRSELFTRQGLSPGIEFPRVLGIEATGVVEACPGGEFQPGETVVTCMGGMGRQFDGGYAEYTTVPVGQVQVIKTQLAWDVLGSLPEMVQTTWGSLFRALQLKEGESLLIRGGTTSIGLAAAALAKNNGAGLVAATTRRAGREDFLKANGADEVFVDNGEIATEVRKRFPNGFNKCLELVGVASVRDSLRCVADGGILCMTGMASGKWAFDHFEPLDVIPSTVCFTTYDGGPADFMNTPLEKVASQIAAGKMKIPHKTFKLDQIAEVHRIMEEESGGGKMVVLP